MDQNLPTCPVCYEILTEPVVFPCQHEICLICFKKSLETANHWCPICRKRISSWARRNVKNPVSARRKQEIEKLMENYNVSALLKSSESTNDEGQMHRKLCEPGEVRKEYLCELHKIEMEQLAEENISKEEAKKLEIENQMFTAQRAEEEKAGEALARSMQEEETKKLPNSSQEEYDLQMAEVLSQDFILKQIDAQKQQLEQDMNLAKQLNKSLDHSVDQVPAKKKKLDTQPITYWFHSSQ